MSHSCIFRLSLSAAARGVRIPANLCIFAQPQTQGSKFSCIMDRRRLQRPKEHISCDWEDEPICESRLYFQSHFHSLSDKSQVVKATHSIQDDEFKISDKDCDLAEADLELVAHTTPVAREVAFSIDDHINQTLQVVCLLLTPKSPFQLLITSSL